jgi:uroporphyrinogen III methyltransferase/synthase
MGGVVDRAPLILVLNLHGRQRSGRSLEKLCLNMTETCPTGGVVYLVGAGPGHPGLITRWGYDLLQRCDAVAYDALIPMELIAGLPARVERHYVGKRAGKHSLPQSQINELLAALAGRGLKVVRLKGGDPFIYGRSGEEAGYLAAAGIPVVMIPGVTAASAAAALSGFSLTNREASSWVFLATGHAAENSGTPVPWEKVGALTGGTLVIYMGLAKLDQVVERLLSSGMDPDTPSIAVQAASTGLQRCVEGPLIRLSSECKQHQLKPPVLAIVGEAIRSRAKEAVTGTAPMAGKTVLVTSPPPGMILISTLLRENGAEPLPYPTIARTHVDDVEGWGQLKKLVNSGCLCLFQNDAEVAFFVDGLLAHGLDVRRLNRFKIIAVGESTDSALVSHGIKADRVLSSPVPTALAECVSNLVPDASLPLIQVHGNTGQYPWTDLNKQCTDTISLTVYKNSAAHWDDHWKDEVIANPPDFITFTGAADVEGFIELLGEEAARGLGNRSCVAAMDCTVEKMLSKYGLHAEVNPDTSSIEAFVSALAGYSRDTMNDSRC